LVFEVEGGKDRYEKFFILRRRVLEESETGKPTELMKDKKIFDRRMHGVFITWKTVEIFESGTREVRQVKAYGLKDLDSMVGLSCFYLNIAVEWSGSEDMLEESAF